MMQAATKALFLTAATIVLLFAGAAPARGQGSDSQGGLAALERKFRTQFAEMQERSAGAPGAEAVQELFSAQIRELQAFLADGAQGDDRFNGRLMLADRLASTGKFSEAQRALRALDSEACPALILLTAADMANRLQMQDLSKAWQTAALLKDAPLEDRMTMGMLLMTVFEDVPAGEKIFADAMAAAADDEGRATVAWFRAMAIREREDLPEGAYEEELRALAARWTGTRHGRIAADRLEAMNFQVGGDALPLSAKDLDGKPVSLADYDGKVLLIDFWASWSDPWLRGVPFLKQLRSEHGDAGFEIVGVCMDKDAAEARRTMAEHGIDWRQVWDGRGWDGDLVLRYAVETVPHTVLIGRDGKIAALTLHTASESGRRQMADAVRRAIEKKDQD